MTPPPLGLVDKKLCGSPVAFANQSKTIVSSSVQAGLATCL